MSKIKKMIVAAFGIFALLGAQTVAAQTYYAFTYGREGGSPHYDPDGVKKVAVVISNVYTIDNCSVLKGKYDISNSIKATAEKEILDVYKRKLAPKRSPWYLDYKLIETYYTTDYNEATAKRREIIKEYERMGSGNNGEALHLEMTLECNLLH